MAASLNNDDKRLFGGAFTCRIPPCFKDVSGIRDIPDNQEVFVHEMTEDSLIIDILEYQGQIADKDAPSYHFEDIAEANDSAHSAEVVSVSELSPESLSIKDCSSVWILSGKQQVSKFHEPDSARKSVEMYLGLLRLPQYQTDIVITYNIPADRSVDTSNGQNNALGEEHKKIFEDIVRSFKLESTDIFNV